MTRLTRKGTIPTLCAVLIPARRRVEAVTAKQRSADGYPDEIETPAERIPLDSRSSHYRKVQNNLVLVVI